MPKVEITNSKTAHVVAVIPVEFGGLNYQPTKEEAFALAWQAASDDQVVQPDRRKDYSFRILTD